MIFFSETRAKPHPNLRQAAHECGGQFRLGKAERRLAERCGGKVGGEGVPGGQSGAHLFPSDCHQSEWLLEEIQANAFPILQVNNIKQMTSRGELHPQLEGAQPPLPGNEDDLPLPDLPGIDEIIEDED